MDERGQQGGMGGKLLALNRRFIDRQCPVSEEHPVVRLLCIVLAYVSVILLFVCCALAWREKTFFGTSYLMVYALYSVGRLAFYLVIDRSTQTAEYLAPLPDATGGRCHHCRMRRSIPSTSSTPRANPLRMSSGGRNSSYLSK